MERIQLVQSINTKVDLTIDATAYTGLTDYGKIMIGDKGFEFFNSRDVRKFVQIPWEEVDQVIVSVMLKGKWILATPLKQSATVHTHLLLNDLKKFYVKYEFMSTRPIW